MVWIKFKKIFVISSLDFFVTRIHERLLCNKDFWLLSLRVKFWMKILLLIIPLRSWLTTPVLEIFFVVIVGYWLSACICLEQCNHTFVEFSRWFWVSRRRCTTKLIAFRLLLFLALWLFIRLIFLELLLKYFVLQIFCLGLLLDLILQLIFLKYHIIVIEPKLFVPFFSYLYLLWNDRFFYNYLIFLLERFLWLHLYFFLFLWDFFHDIIFLSLFLF